MNHSINPDSQTVRSSTTRSLFLDEGKEMDKIAVEGVVFPHLSTHLSMCPRKIPASVSRVPLGGFCV